MALVEEFIQTGSWLFRWRSYLPIVLLLAFMISMYFDHRPLSPHAWILDLTCIVITFFGELIRIYVVGYAADRTSGRNTQGQEADSINMTGAYSLVRHPLYLANFVMWLGLAIFSRNWWMVIIFALCYWLYYERIMFTEEDYLKHKFGEQYTIYAGEIPPFLPVRWNRWARPPVNFNFRKVLRKENASIYAVVITYSLLIVYRNLLLNHQFSIPFGWIVFLAAGTLVYLVLRILKKKTKLLKDQIQ